MKKEILTEKNIKSDLKQHFIRQIPEIILSPVLIAVGFFLWKFIILFFLDLDENYIFIFSIVYFFTFSLLVFYNIVVVIVSLILVSKNKYKITVDQVTDKLPFRRGIYIGLTNTGYLYRPYTLVFAKSGKYKISSYENYNWSDLFAMQDKRVYESTSLDDEFYVVNIGKRKNVIAYNKKQFELME